jgi:hypothetical protein
MKVSTLELEDEELLPSSEELLLPSSEELLLPSSEELLLEPSSLLDEDSPSPSLEDDGSSQSSSPSHGSKLLDEISSPPLLDEISTTPPLDEGSPPPPSLLDNSPALAASSSPILFNASSGVPMSEVQEYNTATHKNNATPNKEQEILLIIKNPQKKNVTTPATAKTPAEIPKIFL